MITQERLPTTECLQNRSTILSTSSTIIPRKMPFSFLVESQVTKQHPSNFYHLAQQNKKYGKFTRMKLVLPTSEMSAEPTSWTSGRPSRQRYLSANQDQTCASYAIKIHLPSLKLPTSQSQRRHRYCNLQ